MLNRCNVTVLMVVLLRSSLSSRSICLSFIIQYLQCYMTGTRSSGSQYLKACPEESIIHPLLLNLNLSILANPCPKKNM
uniref:Putative secreted protein n=1 Tax=Anopheles marajoara TaxID=58244 RepID=A0A2M4CC09_9DIPT